MGGNTMSSNNMSSDEQSGKKGRRFSIGGASVSILIITFLVGSVSWNGVNVALDWTNTESFCVSCHEMRVNLEEYEESVHDKNRTGVKATCPDCHVPKEIGPKLYAKILAVKDIYYHLTGSIDTQEKYDAHRLSMAEAVWARMKSTDSRECRNCHDVPSMLFEEQEGRAARKHENMLEINKTCIDCHKGVAHELPDGYDEDEDQG